MSASSGPQKQGAERDGAVKSSSKNAFERAKLDAAYLAQYQVRDYARPAVAVDLVVFTIVDGALELLLIRRGAPPFLNAWALPGGFVRVGDGQDDQGEDVDQAAQRELQEETGLRPETVHLEQFAVFGAPNRDPRLRVISVAYFALVPPELGADLKAGADAAWATFVSFDDVAELELAFDHHRIVERALFHIRRSLDRRPLAFALVQKRFTARELRAVYEVLGGRPIDAGNFSRRVQRMVERGVVAVAEGQRVTGARPAKVFQFVR